MFAEVVSQVFFSGCPGDVVHVLGDPVFEPIESHVDCFAAALFDCAIEDAIGSAVVSDHGCGRLVVPKFFACIAERYNFSGVVV